METGTWLVNWSECLPESSLPPGIGAPQLMKLDFQQAFLDYATQQLVSVQPIIETSTCEGIQALRLL